MSVGWTLKTDPPITMGDSHSSGDRFIHAHRQPAPVTARARTSGGGATRGGTCRTVAQRTAGHRNRTHNGWTLTVYRQSPSYATDCDRVIDCARAASRW
jgi:hypothetical protein